MAVKYNLPNRDKGLVWDITDRLGYHRSSPMSQIVSTLDMLTPNASNLFVSDLYLRRNGVLGLAAEAVEHQQDLPKIQGPVFL